MSLQAIDADQAQGQGVGSAVWYAACPIAYTRDTWVKLLNPPNAYAADEAKLLCQESLDAWVVWVPGYGELVVDRSYFHC